MQRWKVLPIVTNDSDAYRDSVRLNSLGSLFFFAHFVLKKERLAKLHWQMCQSLETEDLHLLMEISMGHFKSTVGTEALSMWWALPFTGRDEFMMREIGYSDEWIRWMKAAHDQNARTLITHEIEARAISMGKAVDEHYVNNDIFRFVFSDILPDNSCTWNDHTKFHKRMRLTGGDLTTGTYEYRGAGQALQGIHVTGIINDDSVGKAAQSNMLRGDGTIMEDLYRWWKQSTTRFDSASFTKTGIGKQLIIGNRWGHADLNSLIRKNHPEFKIESHSAEGGCCQLHPMGKPIFPEEYSMERLQHERATLGAYDYCFPPQAPVLMSDWSEKSISEIKVGDEVVGYKKGHGNDGKKRQQRYHLTKSKVLATGTRNAWVVKARLASGRTVECTSDHKWFVSNSWRTQTPYLPLNIGRDLVSVYTPTSQPTPDQQRDFDWLGGMMDGEGSVNPSTISLAQSNIRNPDVCKEIDEVCARLGISYHKQIAKGGFSGSKMSEYRVLRGGRSLMIRLLRDAKMAKSKRFVEKLWSRPGRVCEQDGLDRVVSIEPIAEMTVHNITTETGNFVSYGYATKNSHFYLNQSVLPEECIFKPEWLRYFSCKQSRPDLGLSDLRNMLLLEHEVYDGKVLDDVASGALTLRMIVDLAHAKKRKRCDHVILVAGYDPESDRIYLMDIWAEATGYAELVEQIYKIGHHWFMRDFWLETVGAQNILKFYLEERNQREEKPLYVNELPYDNSENAKINRIEALEPAFKNGQIWCQRWQKKFTEEYNSYPAGLVDVLDVLGYLPGTLEMIRRRGVMEAMERQKQDFTSRVVGPGGY
jgi:hypothetical protein